MKFTLSWLKDHLDTKLELNQIIDKLTNIGLEVEEVKDRSTELKPFKVAFVIKAEKHPNADRLKVCQVKTSRGIYQVVCGAPNAKTGMKGIFAPEGSFIPGTEIILKKTNIRGIDSSGMLVSEKEMGISEDHEGIIEVDKSYGVGESFAKVFGLDDPIINVSITPNRGDCLSVRGIARDLAAAGAGKLKTTKFDIKKGNFISSVKWKRSLDKNNNKLCPAVAGRFFKGVKNISSPNWLKRRLIAIGLRPISALVDITNYITYDLGRPLHVFDADKVSGDLTMRLAKNNEHCKTLDGKDYKLSNKIVVISDKNIVHAIGGIMGGIDSSCSESTKNVFLEVALFDPINIARTGRYLDLQSDARYRFERGIDPYSLDYGIDAATNMILKLCGGTVSKITKSGNYKINLRNIKYDFTKVKKLCGVNIDKKKQKEILKKLGFKITGEKNNLCKVSVPTWRPDIDGDADIVEEVVRIFGFDKIEPESVIKNKTDNLKSLNLKQSIYYKSKRFIASNGYLEVVTWSFMSSKFANYFNKYNDLVKLDNPISSDLDVMRPSIIPNLLDSINKNQSRLFNSFGIFEVGPEYENLYFKGQHMMATGIKYGEANPANWIDEKRSIDVYDIKRDVYSFFSLLGISLDGLQILYESPKWYHPGKSCTIKLGQNILGYFGEINPEILDMYEIKNSVCGFEIFLNNLDKFISKRMSVKKAFKENPFQPIERDFAFIVDKGINSNKITDAIKKTHKELIKDIRIFDIFEGDTIPDGKKSVAIKIIMQPEMQTFTDKDIENISNKIIENVKFATGGSIRE
ncbi:MAG: Phenylalanine--tRNA ligase beta subunit [Alphaproteobacteria bacterium MarineAlpha5_Bin11]|nr:phenylalanine--tRNA ligase subunit beta [Pelagibacteraceae bacterium]PPR44744.1 MAG: Phenylalanine--tRNA ligase beta subunit [Alphaproteobacteria bacterium MarineAlpha5_Bin11]PPR52182.1 MAG: Phenylalanine--tRNA ligase beta subunit [Alphaproteobacteria bacterium MarineAlpha5_Bin10]|tara:strand:+ start:2107 stop:4512 length:2406 start_codon:yes stop_codon:yes gene_type:complete